MSLALDGKDAWVGRYLRRWIDVEGSDVSQ